MKIKHLDGNTIPQNYTLQNQSDLADISMHKNRAYFYLGDAQKTLTFSHRVKIAVRATLITLFTIGFGPAFSEKVRDDFRSAWVGKRSVHLCVSSLSLMNERASDSAKRDLLFVVNTLDWSLRVKQNLWTGLGVD
ncbi:MAG: hypothetical protein LLF94_09360 [Chlamydiales bacterium]|nr:hypothetical protein [Chlamydiales bacterium]